MAKKRDVIPADPAMEAPDTEALSDRQAWRDLSRAEKRTVLIDRVKQNEERIQQRRAKKGLPPLTEAQLRRRRAAIRKAIARGDARRPITRRAVRRAVREQRIANQIKDGQPTVNLPSGSSKLVPSITPENRPQSGQGRPDSDSAAGASSAETEDKVQSNDRTDETVTSAGSAIATAEPEKQISVDAPATPLTTEQKLLLQQKLPARVKDRLKNANPTERRRILRELRKRRASQKSLRDARRKLRDIRNRSR